MTLEELQKAALGGAGNLTAMLDGVEAYKKTLSPEMRAQVEKMEKENPIIQESKEKLKNFTFDTNI